MKLELEFRQDRNAREIKPRGVNKEVLTDDIYEQMSYANKLLTNIYETFVGDLTEVAVYVSPNGDRSYYVAQEQLEQIAKKFKLV